MTHFVENIMDKTNKHHAFEKKIVYLTK